MAKWKPGASVICVDDSNYNNTYDEICPVAGQIYTVRSTEGNCLRFREITNPPHEYADGTKECLFRQDRFDSKKPGGKP
jgi:hypothetical protein